MLALSSLGTGTPVDTITPSDPQDGPGLVVPENPLGTIGSISGLAIAVIVFVFAKKR